MSNPSQIALESPAKWHQHVMNAAQLNTMAFPEFTYVVNGLIPEGLTILAGRPKIGKSWMALELCSGVASGAIVLGKLPTIQGDVLYCALEDNPRRLKLRLRKQLAPTNAEWPKLLTLATQWRRLDEGGVSDIAEWAASVQNPRLVVLDTLAGVRPPRLGNEALYDGDYRALVSLHRLAAQIGIAISTLYSGLLARPRDRVSQFGTRVVSRQLDRAQFARVGVSHGVCNLRRNRNHLSEHAEEKLHPVREGIMTALALDDPAGQVAFISSVRHGPIPPASAWLKANTCADPGIVDYSGRIDPT